MRSEISHQKRDVLGIIGSGNLEGISKDEVAVLVKGNLMFSKDMDGLDAVPFVFIAGFPSLLPFKKKKN